MTRNSRLLHQYRNIPIFFYHPWSGLFARNSCDRRYAPKNPPINQEKPMRTRRNTRTMWITTVVLLGVGIIASAQNLVVDGTTTGAGSSYFATVAGSSV